MRYTFEAQIGDSVPDQSGGNHPIQIPTRPIVLEKTFLLPPWHQFKLNRSFLFDTILNVIGFIPLGAVLYGWLRQTGLFTGRNNAWATLMMCSILSLSSRSCRHGSDAKLQLDGLVHEHDRGMDGNMVVCQGN